MGRNARVAPYELSEGLFVGADTDDHEGPDIDGLRVEPGGNARLTRGLDRPLNPFGLGACCDGDPVAQPSTDFDDARPRTKHIDGNLQFFLEWQPANAAFKAVDVDRVAWQVGLEVFESRLELACRGWLNPYQFEGGVAPTHPEVSAAFGDVMECRECRRHDRRMAADEVGHGGPELEPRGGRRRKVEGSEDVHA